MTIRKLSHGGGLFNILEANAKWPVPNVGDGATILHYSDRDAATVIEVAQRSGTVYVTVQRDKATMISGSPHSEVQRYTYERDPNGGTRTYRRTKEGQWQEVTFNEETKRWRSTGGGGIRFGERDSYYDPCF